MIFANKNSGAMKIIPATAPARTYITMQPMNAVRYGYFLLRDSLNPIFGELAFSMLLSGFFFSNEIFSTVISLRLIRLQDKRSTVSVLSRVLFAGYWRWGRQSQKYSRKRGKIPSVHARYVGYSFAISYSCSPRSILALFAFKIEARRFSSSSIPNSSGTITVTNDFTHW